MANIRDGDDECLIVNFVDDPVISNPDAPGRLASKLDAAGRTRVVGESIDRGIDTVCD